MTRRCAVALAAMTLAASLGGCGGGSNAPAAGASASPSPSATNTVAGCQAAAVRAIVAGSFSDPQDGSGDYPECVGLTEAQLTVAAQGTMEDPAVKKATADIVDKGLPGVEISPGALPTLPPDPMAAETPTSTP